MTGEELKISLLSLDETLANVARKLDMTPQNLDGILKTKDIKTGLIERLCKVYHVSSTFFFNESREGVNITAVDHSQAAGRDLHIGTSARESELEKENQELRQQLIDAQSKIIRLMEAKNE